MTDKAWWRRVRQLLNPAGRRRPRRVRPFRPAFDLLEERLPPAVTLSVSDPAPFPKPDSGQLTGLFVVTRSGDLEPALQMSYTTQDGTGPKAAHAGIDYVATAGTLAFAPYQTTATIAVPVLGNNVFQANKTFTVSLSNPLYLLPGFGSEQTVTLDGRAGAVVVGDLNGDGLPDLVLTDVPTAVSVLLNTTPAGATAASFAPAQTFPASFNPSSVALGDFNGDGAPDLAIGSSALDFVAVMLNTTPAGATTASFSPPQTFATPTSPRSVAVADFNGDGKPDLAAGSRYGTVSVLLNTTPAGATSASFAPQQTFGSGLALSSLAVGDFNGDGLPDLAFTDSFYNSVAVLLNTTPAGATAPAFAPQQTFGTGVRPASVAAGDLNGDGLCDLAVANYASNTVSVLLNTTPAGATVPSFAPQQTIPTGLRPISVVLADLNGDGAADLAVGNQPSFSSGTVEVLLNTTPAGADAASFAPPQTYATRGSANDVAVGDISGDGNPDLVIAHYTTNTLSIFLNTEARLAVPADFAAPQAFATGGNPYAVAVGDLNGDGKPDLAVVNRQSSAVAVLLNTTPAGATTPSFSPAQTFAVGLNADAVAVGDFNGDGISDLVVSNASNGTVSVLLNTTPAGATTPSFAPQQTFNVAGGPGAVAVGDFNNDGKPDVAVTSLSFPAEVSVLLDTTPAGATTASFAPLQTFFVPDRGGVLAVGDFNGDGKPDLAVTDYFNASVLVLLNTTPAGSTTPAFLPAQSFATPRGPVSLAAADLNGDGKPDLAIAGRYGTLAVLLDTTPAGATVPSFAPQQTFDTGILPKGLIAADLNGDGRPDLAFTVSTDVNNRVVSVLLNTTPAGATTASFAPQQTAPANNQPGALAVGDFNGDGMPDLAAANYNPIGTISVLLNTAAPVTLQGSPATGTISSAEEAPATITPVAGSTPQSAEVGTAFAVPLAVEVYDAAGNPVQGVRVIFKAPRHGPGGTFDDGTVVTVVTDANGLAVAPLFVANDTAGSYTVTARAAGGSRPATGFDLTNTPPASAALRGRTPENAAPDAPVDVTLAAADDAGNIDPTVAVALGPEANVPPWLRFRRVRTW